MTPERKKALGTRLRTARRCCDFSQDYVAELLGVKRQTVSAWETGVTLPTAFQVADLAAAYCTSAHYLLFGVHWERVNVQGLLPTLGVPGEPATPRVQPCAVGGQAAPPDAHLESSDDPLQPDVVGVGLPHQPATWLGSILGRSGTP